MELHEAMAQITEIRAQIARTETFRGYRAATVGFTGLLALAAAAAQAFWIPQPQQHISAYLTLWISVAVISVVATAWELSRRCRQAASPWTARLTWMAVEQFLPCLVAGGLLTFAIDWFAAESLWMLPGLWSILFSLGVFASCRLLPRAVFCVGGFYLMSGILCLVMARGDAALSPWAMAVPFGIGQFMLAAVLYRTLERTNG